jgi:hypothetical protein
VNADGSWTASSAAIWDMLNGEQRPWGWTSADAAGLPIFPGLVRYDEVASGAIHHALRFTVVHTRNAFTPPATHIASSLTGSNVPPMGMRIRLKAGFDVSGFSAANQAILNAMKKYGMIVADNGSSMYFQGAPDARWNLNDLNALKSITAANFEVVQMGPIYTSTTEPTGAAPAISSFSASAATVTAGTPVTLSWNVSGASYVTISPQVGPVRGSSTSVSPAASTTYVLTATNAYGSTTATVSVKVQ